MNIASRSLDLLREVVASISVGSRGARDRAIFGTVLLCSLVERRFLRQPARHGYAVAGYVGCKRVVRILQDYAREHRGDTKRHDLPTLGAIDQIAQGFGRIAADAGHYVYFHSNSVHGIPFEELSVGAVVGFEEEQGDKGPQAAAVRLWRGRGDHAVLPFTR